jgi:heavy metal sensor kinase
MFLSLRGTPWRRTDVRLTVWYSVVLFTILALACSFLGHRLHSHMMKQADALLRDEAYEIQALLTRNPDLGWLDEFKTDLAGRKQRRLHFRLFDSNGDPVRSAANGKGPFGPLRMDGLQGGRSESYQAEVLRWKGVPYRQITTRLQGPQGSLFLQISMDLKPLRNAMENFYRNLLILIPVSLVLCAVGGWLLARRSLSPIQQIATTTERVSAQNLRERLPTHGTGDELDNLATTINRMLDRLQSSFDEIRKFSGDASHELRTPLCAMRGEAEILLSKQRSAAEYREAVERFMEQFDRMNRLTNDLLLLARFEAGPSRSSDDLVDVGVLLRDLVEFFEVAAQDRGVCLGVSIGAIPPVTGERMMLQQAFSNLIDNAIKYTHEGGTVTVEAESVPPWVEIRIRDTGVGIPKEDLPHVFERFYRVDKSRSRQTGGSGLGLSIARKILERQIGRIELQSEPEHGTTVIVWLPLAS